MSKFSSPFLAKSPLNNGKKKYKKGGAIPKKGGSKALQDVGDPVKTYRKGGYVEGK